jgi:16S rRNA (uracil1498-N3)-methyltransferase
VKRFFSAELGEAGDTFALALDTSHHLVEVCRARVGQSLRLFDGAGHEATAELVDLGPPARVRQVGPRRRAAPQRPLWAVIAVVKGNAMEHGLRMGVEAGVTHVLPCTAERTVPKGDRHDRWLRVLTSASAQCGRADVPHLAPLASLHEQMAAVPEELPRFVAAPGAARVDPCEQGAGFAIGPEGGWSPVEIDRFVAAGWAPMGLGDWVLRADTAVAVAASLLSP